MTAELRPAVAGSGRWRSPSTRVRVLAGLLALILLVAGGAFLARTLWPGSDPAVPPTGGYSDDEARWREEEARQAAIEELFERRSKAVLTRDRAAFLATIDSQSGAFKARQSTWFDNLAAVPFEEWRYEPGPADPSLLPPERKLILGADAVVVTAEVVYRLRGFDRVGKRYDQHFTLVQRDGRWLVADDADGVRAGLKPATELWDLGRVTVAARDRVLVLGMGPPDLVARYAAEVDAQIERVIQVVGGDWPQRVVIVVPRTTAQMARLLGDNPPDTYAQIGAITRGELGTTLDESVTDRIHINPAKFGQLLGPGRQRAGEMSPRNRRQLLVHELTHVAARPYTQDWTPKWLSEGFADYVAFKGKSPGEEAVELRRDVRAGRLPSRLPVHGDFSYTNERLKQAYAQSWLAARYLAERYGEQKLVRFYRSVGSSPVGTDAEVLVEQLMRSQFGTTTAQFTRDWRAYIKRVLG